MIWIECYSALLCLLYGAVLGVYAWRFRQSSVPVGLSPERLLIVCTLLLHAGFLLFLGLRLDGPPVNLFMGGLSALALGVAFAYLIIEWLTRERSMGLWVLGLSFLFQVLSATQLYGESAGADVPKTPVVVLHVVLALVGYCALSLSAAFSVMYLAKYHQLKARRWGLIVDRLPSLDQLERLGYRAIHFGVGFLLVGLVTGEWLLFQEEKRLVWADSKIIVSVLTCGVYCLAILMRQRLAIQGKRFALLSLIGFAIVLFSLLVVDKFTGSFHQY